MYRCCSSCLITLLSVFGMNPKIKPSVLLLQHNLFYALMKRCIKATVPKSLVHSNLLMLPKAFKNILKQNFLLGNMQIQLLNQLWWLVYEIQISVIIPGSVVAERAHIFRQMLPVLTYPADFNWYICLANHEVTVLHCREPLLGDAENLKN